MAQAGKGVNDGASGSMTFWEHLDELRGVIIRCVGVLLVAMIVAFVVMPQFFDSVILAPCRADFPLYKLLGGLSGRVGFMPDFADANFEINLININLTTQFMLHITASFWTALLVSLPIILYLLWLFIRPGLYDNERRAVTTAFGLGSVMFYLGVGVSYFVVFPLTLRFLYGYQISREIANMLSLTSYMDNFFTLNILMGVMFELPLLAWILGRMGLITRTFFKRYRRHAIVALLVLAAVITPTGDPFTLMVVFVPVYALWELGACFVGRGTIQSTSQSSQP